MTQLTIMLLVPGRARADVLIKEDRAYYRFATENTEDEGDLPGLKDRFTVVTERLLDALKPLSGEKPMAQDEMKISVFVDNVAKSTQGVTEEGMKRLTDELARIDDTFGFVKGFA